MNPETRAQMQAFIKPLNMNGLEGRMLQIPSTKKKHQEILLVYGHHSSIERMFGIGEAFADYGNVTMPDLPGFGGMDSYYEISILPSLDSMADYMATFMRLRYKKKKVTIIGMSLGFVIITRMLQRYPELAGHVSLLISLAGFSHGHDLMFSKSRRVIYRTLTTAFSTKLPSIFFYNVILHPPLIRAAYSKTHNAKSKFDGLGRKEYHEAIEFEIELWRCNDVRTYMRMGTALLTLDNCRVLVDLPVHHVAIASDQYLDPIVTEQHLRVVFSSYTEHFTKAKQHAPSIIARKADAENFIPKSLKKLLLDNL